MKIIIVKDKEAGGKKAYDIFVEALKKGSKTFGLATGGTPETTYKELVNSDLDFRDCISVNLDEYVGLTPENPQSYNYYMHKHLFNSKPFKKSYLPNGSANDEKKEIERYNDILEHNPIDLQLLGIGKNGHIGFNEPGSPIDAKTRKVHLTESTIAANARYFKNKNDVPQYAYSMGIGSIMQAKEILVEAFGTEKAKAVAKMVEGEFNTDVPASVLQRHANVTVIIDEQAAKLLKKNYK